MATTTHPNINNKPDPLFHKGGPVPKAQIKKYSTRPGPPYSAKEFLEGEKRRGNDGCMWIVKLTANGVKRWSPVQQ